MKLLLKNPIIYDGTISEPYTKDIYIEDGIIKKIDTKIDLKNVKTIDCTNLVVAPGFIDAHSHNDFFVDKENADEMILPFIKQGITTQIVGNCGFSAYGFTDDSLYKHLSGGSLFKANKSGNLNEYMNDLKGKLMVNIVPLIGHGTTRTAVAGYSAKALTNEELAKQMKIVEDALKAGAFGGSLGLMYVPGMFAPSNELIEFAKMVKKYNGILTIHTRANSKIALGYPLIGKPHIEQALDEVIVIMEKTGVKVEYSHLIFVGKASWKCVSPMLKKFKEARASGYDIGYDIYPFTYGASVITVVLPSWYLKLPEKDRIKPLNLFKLKLIINITKKLLGIDYSDMIVSYISPEHSKYEGKNVLEIAQEEKMDPFKMYLKLVNLSKGKGRIMLGRYYNQDIIIRLMNDDLSLYMTDAWYEETGTQNAGTYQAFPFFIQKTRENHIPLERTINKMTKATAERFGISDRGYLCEGYAADITIFDYNEICINEKIPDQTPKGIKYVLVNGEILLDNNKYTNKKSGIILKKSLSND